MAFVYPSFFWALSVLAIPILVHLFNFRRYKRILFTNVRFLKEVNEETRSQQKLKHLLILLSRCLALVFLVAAFAQPYFPGRQKQQTGVTSVVGFYLDNSFSMNAESEGGHLLELGKNKISEALKAYKDNDRFFLITNTGTNGGRNLLTKDELVTRLDEVEEAPSQLSSEQVFQKATAFFSKAERNNKELFFISDMQKSMLQKNISQKPDTTFQLYTLPLRAESSANLSIDSVWFGTPVIQPEKPTEISVSVSNHGDEAVSSVSVTLFLDGIQKAAGVLDVESHASKILKLDIVFNESGWHRGELRIQDHPVVFDDIYYFTVPVKKEVQISGIHEQNPSGFISKLFATDPYYNYIPQNVNQVDYTSFKKLDFIILDELTTLSSGLLAEVNTALNNGASVLFIPNPSVEDADWKGWLNSMGITDLSISSAGEYKVSVIHTNDELFSNVFEKLPKNPDLPSAKKYYRMQSAGNARALLSFSNGDPLLTVQQAGKGKLYISAVPLNDDWSNFHRHALFVPMVLRMSFYNRQEFNLCAFVGSNNLIKVSPEIKRTEGGLKLVKDKFEILPEYYIRDNETYISDAKQIAEAGIYSYTDGNLIQPIAFNYSRGESELTFANDAEIAEQFEGYKHSELPTGRIPLGETLKKGRLGTPLWKWCISLVLLFLLFEILLLRLWNNSPKKIATPLNA